MVGTHGQLSQLNADCLTTVEFDTALEVDIEIFRE